MAALQHKAFYLSHDGDRDWLMGFLENGKDPGTRLGVDGLHGEVFSNHTLQHFITEEIRHEHFEIHTGNNPSLVTSSSGEQRKALLSYIISRKPGFIVLENVFESIDQQSRQSILASLNRLAKTTLLLQVFNRKNELLPFIESIYVVRGRNLGDRQDPGKFRETNKDLPIGNFTATIPPPLLNFEIRQAPLIKMNKVSVQFDGRPVLRDITWEINPGEFWQLTGPNGSGKSTLLSLITGNSPKGYGQDLHLFGHRKGSGETVWDIKQQIGFFTPSMTLQFERRDSVMQMVISGFFDSVGLYIKPTDRQVQLAGQWLSVIGMHEQRNKAFIDLPEGHQRMVLLARAMVKHPPLLILDEPTSGLDDEMAAIFTSLVNKISAETSTAILYVSHKAEEGLEPEKIFTLSPGDLGSSGQIAS